jgi:hypothetical protein
LRPVRWCIAVAAAAVLAGCSLVKDEPAPAEPGAPDEALARAETHFQGRWYPLDKNLSCLPDRTVTFAEGKATYETFAIPEDEEGGDQPLGGRPSGKVQLGAAEGEPVTLPYRLEKDPQTGSVALVVVRTDGEDRYWIAGPDFLLALTDDGYDVMAHCD